MLYIILIIICVIIISSIVVFGSTYLIVIYCSSNESRFEWVPFGNLYKQNCIPCCARCRRSPLIIIDYDDYSLMYDNDYEYMIDIDDAEMLRDKDDIERYKDHVESFSRSISQQYESNNIIDDF